VISFVKGFLFEQREDSMVIDVNGVGLEVIISPRTKARLPGRGESIFVYTHLQVLENEFKLYGFLEREELQLFQKLLGVSGIGAKVALNILGAIDPRSFYQAIASKDEKVLVKIPGIGKKTASRLIFELKDKVESDQLPVGAGSNDSNLTDVFEALEALGYNRSEVFPLVLEMQARGELGESVEDNLKRILKARAVQIKR
jgi:Holliday junction DNA helicase RuvA